MTSRFDQAEQRQIERELAADARTHEGLLREKRMEELEQTRASRIRDLHAAVGYAILKRRGEARYKEIREDTGIRDKQLSKTLKEMKLKRKITSRVDNTQRPPAVYYRLTKKGYEDKGLQRELLTEVEIPSLIMDCLRMRVDMNFHAWHEEHAEYKEGFDDPLGVAREMVDSIFSAVLFIINMVAEDSLKRIISNEVLGIQKGEGIEVPLEFYSITKLGDLEGIFEGEPPKWLCGSTPDLTDYIDIEEILTPRFVRGLTRAICYYLMGVRHIEYAGPEDEHQDWIYWPQGDYGLTDEQMKKIAEERSKALSQALAEKMKVGEGAIMEVLYEFWHGRKGDAMKAPLGKGDGRFQSILFPGYPIYRYTPTLKKR